MTPRRINRCPADVRDACQRVESECPGWLVWWRDDIYYAAPEGFVNVGTLSARNVYVLSELIKMVESGAL